ncbi:unnamed protein product [Trichobilharzia regenti]|nr:unnamed protein product [Trichobilharzia regenti]
MAKFGRGIQIALSWVPASDGHVPNNAIKVDDHVYIARCKHDNYWIPGKVTPGHSSAYYGNSKTEISSKQYEVLCDSSISHEKKCYEWEPDSDGNVPKNAIVAGITSDTPIYIAKAAVNGEMCIGKVSLRNDF